jgi:hypothetical protein
MRYCNENGFKTKKNKNWELILRNIVNISYEEKIIKENGIISLIMNMRLNSNQVMMIC